MEQTLGFSATKTLGAGIAGLARALTLPFGAYGTRVAAHASGRLAPVARIATPRGTVRYAYTGSNVAKHASRMMSREPDTIAWIEECIQPGDHLWDIGANIGIYSIYACLCDGVTATAFEPVSGNFGVLVNAITLNDLGARITPLAMGVSDKTGLLTIYLIDIAPGSGLHALDKPANVQGAFEPKAAVTVPVIRGDDAIAKFGVRQPTHIKIDVDGHEIRVLEGLLPVLPRVKSLWIEMMDEAEASGENARIEAMLTGAGFARAQLTAPVKGENRLYINRKH
jgi:FkbM family methyltransferase